MKNPSYARLRLEHLEDRNCPAPVGLATTITTGGAEWTVSNSTSGPFVGQNGSVDAFGITDASLTASGQTDAYDGAFMLAVNGIVYQDPDGTVDLTGTTITSDPAILFGLDTSVQYFFDTASATIRALYTFTNNTGSSISATVSVGHDLGSDSDTVIEATSDGNGTLDPGDRFVITSDGAPFSDPVLTFIRFGFGSVESLPMTANAPGFNPVSGVSNDAYIDSYDITVPAGATRRIMVFGQLSETFVDAETAVGVFANNGAISGAGLLDGLTQTQLAEIVNWNFPASATEVSFFLDANGTAFESDPTAGVIVRDGPGPWSAITQTLGADGTPVLYAINKMDSTLWEFWTGFGDAPGLNANWRQISTGQFREISATVDQTASGGTRIQQVVFGITADGTLWEHNADFGGAPEGTTDANWAQLSTGQFTQIAAAEVFLTDLINAPNFLPAETIVFGITVNGNLWEHNALFDGLSESTTDANWRLISSGNFFDITAVLDWDVTTGAGAGDDVISGSHPVVYGILAGSLDLWEHNALFDGLPEGTTDANWRQISTGQFLKISATIDLSAEGASGTPALRADPVLFATLVGTKDLWEHNDILDGVLGNEGETNANWALISTGQIEDFNATFSRRLTPMDLGDPVVFAMPDDDNLWEHLLGIAGGGLGEGVTDANWLQITAGFVVASLPT